MENDLDEIADGNEQWVPVLERFWKDFKKQVTLVDDTVTRQDVAEARDIGMDPTTGKPISVRYGKYGPFVQMGTKDDEEKPKFASLKATQKMDSLTLADALELFKMPRTIGQTAGGEAIKVAIGRFGPYVQYGAKKYVSIKTDDPYTIELPRALELIQEKEVFEANRTILDFPEAGIQVLNGRYGPYITDKVKNAKMPKDRDPKTLTLDECKELIAAAPARGKRFGAKKTAPAKTAVVEKAEPAPKTKAAAKAAPAAKPLPTAKTAPAAKSKPVTKAKAPAKKSPAKRATKK
jgi:DNA topoisomerase-1